MHGYWKRFLAGALVLCLAPIVALAQSGACPDIVKAALAAADQLCQNTGRNQACYGNVDMTAQPQPGVKNFRFSQVGDTVDVASIQSLILSPMDQSANKWGVALLKLQANIPDTLPGQNVTFLLFGDVQLINAVSANGAADLHPMQAFFLRTGIGDAQCTQAPQSGMLVQTPKGVGEVTFNVNGVDVQMGSTVFFQAEAKKQMTVSTLEGAATITAKSKTRVIVPGTLASVPLGQSILDQQSGGGAIAAPAPPIPLPGVLIMDIVDLLPKDIPDEPRSYADELETLQALPLDLLERTVEIAEPLTDEEVQQINEQVDNGVLCGEAPLPSCEELQSLGTDIQSQLQPLIEPTETSGDGQQPDTDNDSGGDSGSGEGG